MTLITFEFQIEVAPDYLPDFGYLQVSESQIYQISAQLVIRFGSERWKNNYMLNIKCLLFIQI